MKKTGRPRYKLAVPEAMKAELAQRIKTEADAVRRDRMRTVLLATDGSRRLVDIAAQVGRATSAVQRWLDAFVDGGIASLLERRKAPGKSSAMQAAAVRQDLAAGLREGRWRTGPQMRAWLCTAHGITLSKTQGYYWLGKSAGTLKVSRPVHVKKDGAAAADFQAHLFEKLGQLNLPAARAVSKIL